MGNIFYPYTVYKVTILFFLTFFTRRILGRLFLLFGCLTWTISIPLLVLENVLLFSLKTLFYLRGIHNFISGSGKFSFNSCVNSEKNNILSKFFLPLLLFVSSPMLNFIAKFWKLKWPYCVSCIFCHIVNIFKHCLIVNLSNIEGTKSH